MICPNCKMAVREGNVFCENCGMNFRNVVIQNGTKFQGNYAPSQNPVLFPANQGMGYGQNPPAMAEKKPISKWILILVAEVILFVLLIYSLMRIIEKNNSPERVAENYFVHMANGDWEEAYQELDLGEVNSNFINAEMFAKARKCTSLQVINNYQIIPDSGREEYKLGQALGGDESVLGKDIRIDYRVKGETENSSYTISLNNVANSEWKVGTSYMICNDFRIIVPQGASVSVDDIALGKDYLISGDYYINENRMDNYSIPYLFAGYHDIKVTMEGMEDVVDIFAAGYDSSIQYMLENMQVKSEVLESLLQKAADNMKQIYSAAMAGKNFNTIKSLFTEDEEILDQIRESYEYLLSELHEKNAQPTKISFRNLQGNINGYETMVDVSFEYQVEYTYEDSWDGSLKNDVSEDNENLKFNFVKENGNWVQTNLGCSVLDY